MFNLLSRRGHRIPDISLPCKYFSFSGKTWRAPSVSSVLIYKNVIVMFFLLASFDRTYSWVIGPSFHWPKVTGFELGLTNQKE